tara:strand:+ start:3544 stop:3951 length:408 start_codon:yes stop_codon:yes gene_type:complete
MIDDTPAHRTFNSYNRHGTNKDQDGNIKTYKVFQPYAHLKNKFYSFPGVQCGTIQKKNSPYWKTVAGNCNDCNVTDCDPTIEFADTEYRVIICISCNENQNYNREIIDSIAEDDKLNHEAPDYSDQKPDFKRLKT